MQGLPSASRDDPLESRRTERRARVRLGGGRGPRTHTPVVGAPAVVDFRGGPDRCPDQEARRRGPADQGDGNVVGTQVHARRADREGNVGPVVDQQGHRKRDEQRARARSASSRATGVLEPELRR